MRSGSPTCPGASRRGGGLSYPALAFEILRLFADDLPEADLKALIDRSYVHTGAEARSGFDTPEIAPLAPLGNDLHLLELFHGPTLAFKDLALQLLGHLFAYELERSGETLNVLGATSGDTGSAAIAALRGKSNVRVFILFPEGRTSRLQELQMTTVPDANVHCLAIEGTFDDCQRIMKALFNDAPFKARWRLGAINSVNCARLLAQVVYYFHAWLRLPGGRQGGRGGKVSFSVPTGNFGTCSRDSSRPRWVCRSSASSSRPTRTTSSTGSSAPGVSARGGPPHPEPLDGHPGRQQFRAVPVVAGR